MDKKTKAKICGEVFDYFRDSYGIMITVAANKYGVSLSNDELLEIENMFEKAIPNFKDLFVDYYIYTDDDED